MRVKHALGDYFASIMFVLILRHLLAFDFLLFVASICIKIYYLARGHQFVSAYAFSMLSVAKIHILINKLIPYIVLVYLFLVII